MNANVIRSRIPSELTADEVRAIRGDERLQREIADAYGLTASAVSLIKARKCRGDVPSILAPPPKAKPVPTEVKITVCPPAQAAGHKPLGGRSKLKDFPESGRLSGSPIRDVHPDPILSVTDAPSPQLPAPHYADDWFMF